MLPQFYSKGLAGRMVVFDGEDTFYIVAPWLAGGETVVKIAHLPIHVVRQSVIRLEALVLIATSNPDRTFTIDENFGLIPTFQVPIKRGDDALHALEKNVLLLQWMIGALEEVEFRKEVRKRKLADEVESEIKGY